MPTTPTISRHGLVGEDRTRRPRAGHDVVRLFLGRGLAIVAVGLAIGTIAAVVGSSALSTLLFGVDRLDLSVYGLAITTLAVVAGVAIWWPARQAATTQPGIILRS